MKFRMMCLVAPCILAGGALAEVDHWFTITLAGTPAGWAHSVKTLAGDVRTMTNTESMKIGRMNAEVTVISKTVWVDRLDGTPISMEWTQEMGDQPVRTRWDFGGGEMKITMEQGERVTTSTRPAPTTPWLTPGAVADRLAVLADAGETEFSWYVLVPDLGATPARQTMQRSGGGEITVNGAEYEVSSWDVTIEGLPVSIKTSFSPDWQPVMSTIRTPFGDIESKRSSKSVAIGERIGPAPELLATLFVRPVSGTIEDQSTASRAFLRLRTLDGTTLNLPASGAQSIAGHQDNSVLLQVDRSSGSSPQEEMTQFDQYRSGSTMVDSSDVAITELAAVAVSTVPPEASTREQAEALREAVYHWISKKGLTTAFASASETVRSHEGDCSEHGVLLAAMLRAEGIPSRVASGLVWMDGLDAFGWHMWTQAFIDGQWIDLDATLRVPFTVGHILVATSALEDGDGQRELLALLGLLGNLEVEVVRVDL